MAIKPESFGIEGLPTPHKAEQSQQEAIIVMTNPYEVRPANFPDPQVIYHGTYSSIAFGIWEGEEEVLAVRYDGENEQDVGFPSAFGNPVWFILPHYLNQAVLAELAFHWQEEGFNRQAWENAASALMAPPAP